MGKSSRPDEREIAAGFSADGYIVDQDRFSSVVYLRMPSSVNGCGWIAAFNLRRALGRPAPYADVCRALEAMHRLRLPGPTQLRALRRYLAGCLPGLREARGREAALRAVQGSRAGILRYWEGDEPHFVTYVGLADGDFRFFNVADGLEDCRFRAEDFFRERVRRGSVLALAAPPPGGYDIKRPERTPKRPQP